MMTVLCRLLVFVTALTFGSVYGWWEEESWDRISFLQSLVAMSVSEVETAEALESVLFVVNLRGMVMLVWNMELVMSVGSSRQLGYNFSQSLGGDGSGIDCR